MLTEIDIERLPSFALDFERGEARGKAEGRAEGRAEEKALIVHRLLRRFDVAQTAELLGLTTAEVEQIASAGDQIGTEQEQHRAEP